MVRRRVEIEPIQDKAKRHTAFTKRRQGLYRKATDLCVKCDAEVAVIAFSKAGNFFAFCNPTLERVMTHYYSDPSSSSLAEECANNVRVEEFAHGDEIMEENNIVLSMTDMEKRLTKAVGNGRPAWDEAVVNLELSKLIELEEAIDNIKSQVATRASEITASGDTNPEGSSFLYRRKNWQTKPWSNIVDTTLSPKRQFDFMYWGENENGRRIIYRKGKGIICNGFLLPVDPWAPNIDSQSIASQLFAVSLFPYLGFLYFLTKSKSAPKLTLFGFYFLLAFVGAATVLLKIKSW